MQAEKEALCVAEAQLRADYEVVLTVLSEMPEVVAQDSAPKKQRQSASAQALPRASDCDRSRLGHCVLRIVAAAFDVDATT